MSIEALQRPQSLRQQVYERLRTALRAGEYRPNQRLTEIGIAEALGVSRTPVREALGLLSREGLLSSMPHGGFKVPDLQVDDLNDIFELRYLLEPYAAGLAARNAYHEGVTGMHVAIQTEKQCLIDSDNIAFVQASQDFRSRLFSMAGNRRLAAAISQVEGHVQFVRSETFDDWKTRTVLISAQEQILEAVRLRDAEAAAKAMRALLTTTKNTLLAAMQQYKVDDAPDVYY
ncbi:MAG: GntR family transcriptional regulator [Rhodospirillaceae bacterium]|nr:GntR family transcriptional regulator [Rhodospirillaceae bacterium]MYH36336.1 GntR family transcriptional regulator [Rhodospirillaceae bacterium]MYK15634.1 GntR family transcriptional regulator [Rhodospirillaceae bacterium]MYK59604.1 GntR family transcriptional regulator [Rhodospirillaceae bacterium]